MKMTKLRTFILFFCVIIISMLFVGWRKNIEPFDCENDNDNDNDNCSMMTYDEHHDIHTKWRDMGYYPKPNSNLSLNNTSSEEPSHNLSAIHFGNKTTIKNCPGGICDDVSNQVETQTTTAQTAVDPVSTETTTSTETETTRRRRRRMRRRRMRRRRRRRRSPTTCDHMRKRRRFRLEFVHNK